MKKNYNHNDRESIEDITAEAAKAIAATNQQLDAIRGVLKATRHNTLPWSTHRQVAKSLRYQLNLRRMWLNFRLAFTATSKKMDDVMRILEQRQVRSVTDCDLSYDKPDHWNHKQRDSHGNKTTTASNFNTVLPTPTQYGLAWRVHKDWFDLCTAVDVFWEQSRLLLTLPDWQAVKPHCPLNGRAAYSVLLAMQTGRASRSNPPHNLLFGWCGDEKYRGSQTGDSAIGRTLKVLSRKVSARRLEKHGPCPNVTAGRNILNSDIYHAETPFQWKQPELSERKSYLFTRNSIKINQRTLCGSYDGCTPRMLWHLHHADHGKLDIWHKIVLKVMRLPVEEETTRRNELVMQRTRPNNAVLTALTGPVVHLNGSDYYAPVIYTEKVSHGYGRERGVRTYYGYVLLRQGWPDMVHCTEAEFQALQNENNIGIAGLIRRLDAASSSYFQRIRDEHEKKLTTNQRYARMLKRLRSIFLPITKADSYQSGNCRPGTADFVKQVQKYSTVPLEEQTAEVSGRELARCWRAAKYIQPDRLNSVIVYMLQKQAKQIQLAYDSLDDLFPVETRHRPEVACQFPPVPVPAAMLVTEGPFDALHLAEDTHVPAPSPLEITNDMIEASVIHTSTDSPASIEINGEPAQATPYTGPVSERLVSHWTPIIRDSVMVTSDTGR